MQWIDSLFSTLKSFARTQLPEGSLTNLLVDGVLAGINGIVIFIPQIAILFLYISILEETGYMSRVVFIMDKIMRRFGMSGKSVIPIVSGVACAIPAIMSARNIDNWRERLITILITPFTTCGARIPVYTILIALVIPDKTYLGIFNLQGITLLALYMLGFLTALFSGYLLHLFLKIKPNNFFVIELPDYKIPSLKNTSITVLEKTKAFVFGAGKIILAISVIVWFLQTNGGESFDNAKEIVLSQVSADTNKEEIKHQIAAYKSKHSYLGVLGKSIEPIVRPLGYDWKMAIGILTSFAAREVFVGTMATIYSVEDDGAQNIPLQERMRKERNPKTGIKTYNLASGLSLLLFYAFAMQCISTLAIVKKETNSWKWPLAQLFGMGALAYISAFIIFQIFK
jgi:ferrous iron transport protein B